MWDSCDTTKTHTQNILVKGHHICMRSRSIANEQTFHSIKTETNKAKKKSMLIYIVTTGGNNNRTRNNTAGFFLSNYFNRISFILRIIIFISFWFMMRLHANCLL